MEPAAKPRPALVIQVFDDDAPRHRVLVAYGTSQKTQNLQAGEFLIAPSLGEPYRLSGLGRDTKFNLAARVELDYQSEWFKVPPSQPCGQSPKLGTLHPSMMRRAQAARDAVKKK